MIINVDDNKYKVKERVIESEVTQYIVTPKKRNCKVCKKRFDSNGKEFLTWTDKEGFRRSGYFCREHLIMVNKVLKEIRQISATSK